MNATRAIQAAGRHAGFFARHIAALVVTVAVPCVLWTVAYFAMLLWAMFSGGGLGGPLAYPGGLLVFSVAAVVASIVLLFPSTALAERIVVRRALPALAGIPIAVAILALLCFVLAGIVALSVPEATAHGFLAGFGFLFAAHLLPLGLYWWVAQGGPLLLGLVRRLRGVRRV